MRFTISGICFIFLFTTVHMLNLFPKDSNYGPYDIKFTRYEPCRGPKSRNSTQWETKIYNEGNGIVGSFNFTFLVQTKINEMKIAFHSLKNNTKTVLWNYKSNDPCNHFAFGSILEIIFKTRNCVVEKGNYYGVINFEQLSTLFLGSSFFYGEFMLKAFLNSKQGNVMCIIIVDRITKKSNQKD